MDDDAVFEMAAKTVNAAMDTKMSPSNSTKKKQKEAGQEQMPIAQILCYLAAHGQDTVLSTNEYASTITCSSCFRKTKK
ncbi:hypothetical protein PS6_001839 [Mucor atramentarius]